VITTAGAKVNPEDSWTRANIGEVVPERMTPFSFSVWAEPMNRLLALSFRHFELDTDRFRFIQSQDGWLTYNIGAVNHLSRLIGLPPMDAAVGTAAAAPAAAGRLNWWRLARHWRGLARSTWGQLKLGRRYDQARASASSIADRYRAHGRSTSDPARLLELAFAAYAELEPFLSLYADATAAAFSNYVLLERAAARLAPGVGAPSLLRSPGVSVTGISAELARAAGVPGRQPGTPGIGEADLERFLREYGHRGWQELELANPTWNTDPAAVRVIAERYRAAAAPERPREPVAVVEPPLPAGWRGRLLHELAARAGEYSAIRENVKHEFYRPIDAIRGIVQKAAAQLAAAGLLDDADAMFFLTADELRELLRGDDAERLRETAAQRRLEWEGARAGARDGAAPQVRTERLEGVGASPGEAVGIARVLRAPDEAAALEPGDILVVEALDIGWTPLFGIVGGIVTAIGGVLSHPCTVAREMRVPVVAGVPGCQELIRSGDRLRIDGASGEIAILDDAAVIATAGGGGS
jgi:pyruvate,water dikinase